MRERGGGHRSDGRASRFGLIAAANGRDGGFSDGKAEGFEANSAAPKNRAFVGLGVGEVRYR